MPDDFTLGRSDPRAECARYLHEHGHEAHDALWFADEGTPEASEAKRLCMQECPLYWPCQTYALEQGIPDGVWGGLDGRDRRRLWLAGRGMPQTFTEDIQRAFNGLTRDEPRRAE